MSRKKKEPTVQDLAISKQLRAILPGITPEDQRALETKVIHGKAEPVVIWNNTVLKGYDVLEICRARNVPLSVKQLPCSNPEEAAEWTCAYAFYHYPNSTESYKKYWIGLRYVNGRKNRKSCEPQVEEYDEYDRLLNLVRRHRTQPALAAEFHVSVGTIQKYGQYAKAINSIMAKNPVMGNSILQERIHVSHTNILLLERLNAEELRRVNYRFDLGGAKIVGISSDSSPAAKEKTESQPGIKAMPEYDPDADFTGLMLTAKTWISSLERTYRVADFKRSSEKIRNQLTETLLELKETIELFCLSLEEDCDGN